MDRLFHIALAKDWERAQSEGSYRTSTLGRSLEQIGFIHLSFAHQVGRVADALYAGRTDLLLLELDPARLDRPVRIEAVPGSDECFPHLYGAFTPDAVLAVCPFLPGPDGFRPPA